jgi:hypothetical protein
MMKKSLLLLGALGVAVGANAQLKNAPSSVVEIKTRDYASQPMPVRAGERTHSTAKTTAVKKRDYNYVDQLAKANAAILAANSTYLGSPYMWFNNDAQGMYSNGLDTINMPSFGMVMHPQWSGYNSQLDWGKGTMYIPNANPYIVDSITFEGYYGRPNTGTFVDTLIIAYTYGRGGTSNIPTYVYYNTTTNQFIKNSYGVDSLYTAQVQFDLVNHTLYKPATSTGPAINVKKIPLGPTDTGSHTWGIAANLSVPAPVAPQTSGNLVAATVTFKSGAPYPAYDTAFRGSTLNPNEPFKWGMVRPYIFVEKGTPSAPGFATYAVGNYNSGQFELLPETDPQTTASYSPTWVWSTNNGANAASIQWPYMDFIISCPTCPNLAVNDIVNYVSLGTPYPNPASSSITLPVTMKESAPLNVSLSNVMGQTVATQRFAEVGAKQSKNVTFNTASLPAGIYIITVEVNGEHMSNRVAVTH